MNELVFYIHGVTPQQTPGPHREIYQSLHSGVAELRKDWPSGFAGAEWGWNPEDDTPRNQELLAQSQLQLGQRVLKAVDKARDFSINPGRLAMRSFREINFYGFSDMFYYASETGKNSIRQAICRQLMEALSGFQAPEPENPVRLTLVGHSAGAVIAGDLLFHLFHPDHPPYSSHRYVDADENRSAEKLRAYAQSGALRLRRVYTFGNPLSAMAMRHNQVVECLAAGDKLNPLHYGLEASKDLPGPRWINFWDMDDLLAWPVEPLMDTDSGMVKDMYINVSSRMTRAHSAYWTSPAVFRAIADTW